MQLPPVKVRPPKTEFRTELLGLAAYHPFIANTSPARIQMSVNSHFAQTLVVTGMTEAFTTTFADHDFGKGTLNIKMPVKGRILKILPRYPASNFEGAAVKNNEDNPETLILYENVYTKEVGVLTIPRYLSFHPYFGYGLVATKDATKVLPGAVIEAGTVLYDTPGKTDSKQYISTVMLNTCVISDDATAEDGFVICRDVLPAFRHSRYETRVIEFGREYIPINLYGDDKEYKFMPDIGEYVKDDGRLIALRKYDPRLAACDMSVNGAQRVDMYDKSIYAKGKGGRVVDIRVTTNYNYESKGLSDVTRQLEKYIRATHRFNNDLVEWYKSKRYEGFTVSRALHVMLTRAMVDIQVGKDRFNKTFKKINVDDFRLEIVVEYEIEPYVGFKMSDRHAAKGVICRIAEPEEMPVDIYGRRADLMMAPEGRSNRMNSGGNHEIIINDAGWHVRRKVMERFGIPFFESPSLTHRTMRVKERERMINSKIRARVEWLNYEAANNSKLFWEVWDFVINYYRAIAPIQAYIYDREDTFFLPAVVENLATIIEDFTFLRIPPDYAVEYLSASMLIKEHVGFERDKVTYQGIKGDKIVSALPARIAPLSFWFSEKTADTWSAVSFGKYQMHGFLAPLSKADKHASPGREQAVNGMSETEGRIIDSVCGPEAAAELADRNNNPHARKAQHRSIITADLPGRIENCVNRKEVEFGGHRGVQIFHHALNVPGGLELRFAREEGT